MTRSEGVGTDVGALVDHLFRHEAGRIVAALCGSLGPARLDLAEEAVQEALVRALRTWPFRGVPTNPAGWLYRAARNAAVDRLRRARTRRDGEPEVARRTATLTEADEPARSLDDDLLRLLFLCAHPLLSPDSRVALTLKLALGFSVDEIGRALVSKPATVGQRISRAKATLREGDAAFELPEGDELVDRLDAVLDVLWLLFGEGHAATSGDLLVRRDLCEEALRLAELLLAHPPTDLPRTRALAALLWLLSARLPARTDSAGELVLLADQDRTLWNRAALTRGFGLLDRSIGGAEETAWHLQAAIAGCHAAAATEGATDWPAILRLYDRLVALEPSPIVALHRAVAVERVHGPHRALAELGPRPDPRLRDHHRFWAVRGELLARAGRPTDAARDLERARDLAASGPERRFLERRTAELAN